jgi:hypothetical protein
MTPLQAAKRARSSLAYRIARRVIEDGECWLWQGQVRRVQPIITSGGKKLQVRRLAWRWWRGPGQLTKAVSVLPVCGRERCVAPWHLTLQRHPATVPKAEATMRKSAHGPVAATTANTGSPVAQELVIGPSPRS